jgi:exopolyphosphatase/pppGpp-phosphohydrolase
MAHLVLQLHRQSSRLQYASLESWVRNHLGCIEHERRVTETASTLFDLTWPMHSLTRADRQLLRLGAVVHDVGRSIDDDTHPQQGARMLMQQDHLPLSGCEQRALAYLTRYHRGCVPELGEDEILRRSDDREGLRTILAILRSADSLDSRSIASPRLSFKLLGRRLQIDCILEHDTPKARKVYGRRKKHRLMEELMGCRVEVTIAAETAFQLAA